MVYILGQQNLTQYVSRVMKYNKKSFQHLTIFFMSNEGITEMCRKFKSHYGFLRADQDRAKKLLSDGLNWLSHLSGCSKSHREISSSCKFFASYQVDLKNFTKFWEYFFWYSTTLEKFHALALVHFIPSLLVIKCTVYVALPKRPINQFSKKAGNKS